MRNVVIPKLGLNSLGKGFMSMLQQSDVACVTVGKDNLMGNRNWTMKMKSFGA